MNLLAITRAAGMLSAYGTDGWSQIQAKLAVYQKSIPSWSVTLAVLDDPTSMGPFGGVASGIDAISLQTASSRIASSLAGGSNAVSAVVILGGADIIPPYVFSNPVTDRSLDPDPAVYTDNPYGVIGTPDPTSSMQPALAVGRLCAGAGDSAATFCALIDSTIANHTKRPLRAGYVEVTNRVWENASASVMSAMAGAGKVLVCPDDSVTPGNANVLDCKYLYCNLHGFVNDRRWMGVDPVRSYVTALSPESFAAQYVAGTIVYTDACYGLQTMGRATSGSCALTLLAQGAAAVVGATGLAFGTAPGPAYNLVDADVMTRAFFGNAPSAASVGACLLSARQSFFSSSPGLDFYQKKTLLEFQLLGDPTLAVS